MDTESFATHVDDIINVCKDTLVDKAREYATEDRLHNFRVAAGLKGETDIQSLLGMMVKHTVSVYDMGMDGGVYSLAQWQEKIKDHINYLIILWAMVNDLESSCAARPIIKFVEEYPLFEESPHLSNQEANRPIKGIENA